MAQHSNVQGNLRPAGRVLTWNEHTHISVSHVVTRLLPETHSVGFIIILSLFYFIIIYLLLFCFAFSSSIGVELLALPIPSKLSTTELQSQAKKLAMWTQEQQVLPRGAQASSPLPLAQLSSIGHSPGFISRSRSFGSSGGCNRRFLRQQRAGYVYSWPGARPVERHNVKGKGYRPERTS